MTAVCCSGRCLGCCRCCSSRRARARWARCRAALAALCVLLGAGCAAAWAGSWSAWTVPGAALAAALLDPLGRRPVLALSVPLQVAALLLVAEGGGHAGDTGDAGNAWTTTLATPTDNVTESFLEAITQVAGLNASDESEVMDAAEAVEDVDDGPPLGVRLARSACAGAALGLALPAALFYLAELWCPSSRGAACCLPAAAVVAGRTMAYGLAAALGPRLAALVALAPPCLALPLLLAAPPSPYWLALRGRLPAPHASPPPTRVRVMLREDRNREAEELEDVVEAVRAQRGGVCAGNWRGPAFALLLVGTLPLAGLSMLEWHLPVALVPFVADLNGVDWMVRVGFGGGALLAVLAVAALSDRCGRRPLLAAALLSLAAAHASLGYFHWFLGWPLPERAPLLAWAIVLGAVCLGAAAGAGLAATAWLVLAEVLPMRIKVAVPALALLLDAGLQCGLDALRVALPALPDAAIAGHEGGLAASWCWAHALWCLLLAVVVAALPEAKRLSLARLHEVLRGRHRHNRQTRL